MQSMIRMAALAILLAMVLSPTARSQSNEEKLQSKLNEPWVKKANWITDYDLARQKAKQEGKHIFAYFSRSYAP